MWPCYRRYGVGSRLGFPFVKVGSRKATMGPSSSIWLSLTWCMAPSRGCHSHALDSFIRILQLASRACLAIGTHVEPAYCSASLVRAGHKITLLRRKLVLISWLL